MSWNNNLQICCLAVSNSKFQFRFQFFILCILVLGIIIVVVVVLCRCSLSLFFVATILFSPGDIITINNDAALFLFHLSVKFPYHQ